MSKPTLRIAVIDGEEHPYELVTSMGALRKALQRLSSGADAAMDFETTSLDPAEGEVRLVQLANEQGTVVIDCWKIPGRFPAVMQLVARTGLSLNAFMSPFEQRWVDAAGVDVKIHDVQNMRKAVLGGGRYSLNNIVEWDLEIKIDKTEQVSDWGAKTLADEQLDYAAIDAIVTWWLFEYWADEIDNAPGADGRWACAGLLDDLTWPVIEMEDAGILLDQAHHASLIEGWSAQLQEFTADVRALLPEDEVANLRSRPQLSDYFSALFPDDVVAIWPRTEKTGQLEISSSSLRMIAGMYEEGPVYDLMIALAKFNRVDKYLSSFGQALINKAKLTRSGRVHARFNIGAAKTLRFSSSGPNLQQMPRDILLFPDDDHLTQVRRSFIAPPGRELISYDYNSIELRLLALLSGDDQLLEDVVFGDVHNQVAEMIWEEPNDKTTVVGKARRSKAKGVSFGIIYGAGPPGLSGTMSCSLEKAASYLARWENRYKKAFQYRHDIEKEALSNKGFVTMVDGGTVYMGRRPELPQCANYPVQRGAWTVMARALIRHRETLMDLELYDPDAARMLATIHDAMMDEAAAEDARAVAAAMHADMVDAYLDVFPGAPTERLLEGGHGSNWAELEELPG